METTAPTRRIALTVAAMLVTAFVGVLATPAHAAGTSCSYNGATHTVTVTMPDNNLHSTLSRSGLALTVEGVACGSATVANTDDVIVNGAAGRQAIEITLANGAIGPGLSSETDTPEIEINVQLGSGTDSLMVTGSAASDNIRTGTTGVNLNGDTD